MQSGNQNQTGNRSSVADQEVPVASPHQGKGKGKASVKNLNALAEALDYTNAEASVLYG